MSFRLDIIVVVTFKNACENEVCDHVAETPSHYLLKCPKFANKRRVMLSEISEIVFQECFNFIDESGRFDHNDENDAHD